MTASARSANGALPPASDIRSLEILDRVRLAFAEKGFDGASMQDLARVAGMSVGNFYRYFPSKAAIVEGLIRRDLAEIEGYFAVVMESPDPMATLRRILAERVQEDCAQDGQIWAEITAAALRKPEIGAVASQMEDEIAGYMLTVFARITGLPRDEATRRFSAHASLIVMMVKATAMHRGRNPDTRADLSALILRIIDRTLDEVVGDALKG